MATIFGYSPARRGEATQTPKAVRVTVREIDGEDVAADTEWLPRSIATRLEVRRVREDDGSVSFEVRADVPEWWVRKLDTRAAWQKRGLAAPPMAQRPW